MKILKYLDNKIWLFTTAILLISSWYFNIIIIYNIIIAILYGIYEYFPVIYDSSIETKEYLFYLKDLNDLRLLINNYSSNEELFIKTFYILKKIIKNDKKRELFIKNLITIRIEYYNYLNISNDNNIDDNLFENFINNHLINIKNYLNENFDNRPKFNKDNLLKNKFKDICNIINISNNLVNYMVCYYLYDYNNEKYKNINDLKNMLDKLNKKYEENIYIKDRSLTQILKEDEELLQKFKFLEKNNYENNDDFNYLDIIMNFNNEFYEELSKNNFNIGNQIKMCKENLNYKIKSRIVSKKMYIDTIKVIQIYTCDISEEKKIIIDDLLLKYFGINLDYLKNDFDNKIKELKETNIYQNGIFIHANSNDTGDDRSLYIGEIGCPIFLKKVLSSFEEEYKKYKLLKKKKNINKKNLIRYKKYLTKMILRLNKKLSSFFKIDFFENKLYLTKTILSVNKKLSIKEYCGFYLNLIKYYLLNILAKSIHESKLIKNIKLSIINKQKLLNKKISKIIYDIDTVTCIINKYNLPEELEYIIKSYLSFDD
jgi:hypothetical protein